MLPTLPLKGALRGAHRCAYCTYSFAAVFPAIDFTAPAEALFARWPSPPKQQIAKTILDSHSGFIETLLSIRSCTQRVLPLLPAADSRTTVQIGRRQPYTACHTGNQTDSLPPLQTRAGEHTRVTAQLQCRHDTLTKTPEIPPSPSANQE